MRWYHASLASALRARARRGQTRGMRRAWHPAAGGPELCIHTLSPHCDSVCGCALRAATTTNETRSHDRGGASGGATADASGVSIVCKDDQSRRSIRFITIWIEKDKIRFIYPCSLVPFGRNPLASRYTSALSFRDAGGLINSPPALKSGFTRFKRGASSDPCRSFVSQCPPGRRQRCAKLMLCSA